MAKQPRSEETRTRLLDAALALYAREGDAGFSVHAIVRESGVSLGSLYHQFGSMDGLSAALYARSMSALLDDLLAALDDVRSPRRGVAAVVRAYLAFTAREPSRARFIHASAGASFLAAHADLLAAEKAPRMQTLAAFFHRHMEAGAIATLPDYLFEMLLIGPVAELTRRALLGDASIDLTEAARILPDRIWAALRRDDA